LINCTDSQFEDLSKKIIRINKKHKIIKLEIDFEKGYLDIVLEINNLKKLYKVLNILEGKYYGRI